MATFVANPRVAAVLAGRRIDPALRAKGAFPAEAVEAVAGRLRETLKGEGIDFLVTSAACGTDLLGLQAADCLGIRTRIVLPLPVKRFRRESVVDRPGAWGAAYDRQIENAVRRNDLVVIDVPTSADPFIENNRAVISEALAAKAERQVAILVWEGTPSGPQDVTADLGRRAARHGFHIVQFSPTEAVR